MKQAGEYQGGFYAILEFIGLYVRYFIFKISQKNKTIKYLSGEEEFPIINKKQRSYCIFVGLLFVFSIFFLVALAVYHLGSGSVPSGAKHN